MKNNNNTIKKNSKNKKLNTRNTIKNNNSNNNKNKNVNNNNALKEKGKGTMEKKIFNEEFITIMGEMADIMMKQGEPFRARAYQKAQETLMTFNSDITSIEQLKGLPGIGSTIINKLDEYVKTGTLAVLERERNNPINILTNIYGVGPKKAKSLIDKGITTIEHLKENKDLLNENQLKGLEYYDDINSKIPRNIIDKFNEVFNDVLNEIKIMNNDFEETKYEIVGSYRRGKSLSGDIDVILTNNNNNSVVFEKFLNKLKEKKILIWEFTHGKTKSLTLCNLPNNININNVNNDEKIKARRVDFLYTSPEEYPFAILYFTGSKTFNTVMRQRAVERGYTLNEHGIYNFKNKVKGDKVDPSLFKTEKDIFNFLDMEYKEPNERIDGRSVEDRKNINMTIQKEPESEQPEKEEETFIIKVKKKKQRTLKKEKFDFKKHIERLKKEGLSYLQTLQENEIMEIIKISNNEYYNENPLMSDELFDVIKEYAERLYPNNPVLKEIGAPIQKGKVKLPFNMPSMNKIKPDTEALTRWQNKYKGSYVLSAKLDGVSGLFTMKNGKTSLFTRGDGTYGQDISYLISYLKLPKNITNSSSSSSYAIRGELIIQKEVFENKYSKEFSNPRNFVSGVINSKTKNTERFNDIDFVAYEVIEPINLKPSEQFILLNDINNNLKTKIKIVRNQNQKEITNDLLSAILLDWRNSYEYEIDGIIVSDDNVYERTKENPDHSFAFKMVLSEQVAEVKVLDVLWSPSKDGYLKPRVQVEPVILGGVKIEYATGFNAKFIEDNKIGIGSVIRLVRSGDVIPHILRVVRPAEKPLMPEMSWKWNNTHVDAILEDMTQDKTVIIKNITNFFKQIETTGLGPGNVTKIVNKGYNSIPKILSLTEIQLQEVLGKKNGKNVFDNIHNSIENTTLEKLMSASNIFGRGFGEKRFQNILKSYPNVLTDTNQTNQTKINNLSKIKGMSLKSSKEFVDTIPDFINFLKESNLQNKLIMNENQTELHQIHPLHNKKIVMTGFRDKEVIKKLQELGADIVNSVSKNTFIVLVKNMDESTGKVEEAKKLGITIMTINEFKNEYEL